MTTGQILISGGEEIETQNGEKAMYFEEPVERKVLRNWQDGKFTDTEKMLAGRLRTSFRSIDLDSFKNQTKKLIKGSKIRNFSELGLLVDNILNSPAPQMQYTSIKYHMNEIGVPDNLATNVYKRWVRCKKPLFRDFAPYAYYCHRAHSIFQLGLSYDLVTTRSTNLVDLEYFYYLPFCMVFCSGDKFHKTMIEPLLRNDQTFLNSIDLKNDLRFLVEEWNSLNKEERDNRYYDFGSYPPEYPDSITHKLWKKSMRPRTASSGNRRHTKEEEKEILQQLKPFMDAMDKKRKSKE